MVRVDISCLVNPTEIPERVVLAVTNVFPDCNPVISDGILTGETGNMDAFSKRIRELRILDATRAVMYNGRHADGTSFKISKQVAYVGKISFCEGEPVLGAIRVDVHSDDIEALIDKVAPRTVDGEEVVS